MVKILVNNNVEAFGKNRGIMHIFFWNLRGETEKIREVMWGRKIARARLKLGTTRIEVCIVVAAPPCSSMVLGCWWNARGQYPSGEQKPHRWLRTSVYNGWGFKLFLKISKNDCYLHHVCLPAFKNSNPTGRVFINISHLSISRKSVEKIQFSLKSDKNNGHFAWRPMYIYDNI